jgi:hypothetical protein
LKEGTKIEDLLFESLINFQEILDYRKWAKIIFDSNIQDQLIKMLADDDEDQDSFDVKFKAVSQDVKKKILKVSPNQSGTDVLLTSSRQNLVMAMLI